jgi:hypothetical protein
MVIPAKAGIYKYFKKAGFRAKHGMTGCGKREIQMFKGGRHDTTVYTA